MTEFSPEAQAIADAYENTIDKYAALAAALRVLVNSVVPEETEAPKAVFDCEVVYKKQKIKIPVKIETPSDYRPGTHKARMTEKDVWLVSITMPKALMSDIKTGSIEMEDQDIDLDDLDQAYEQDLDKEANHSDAQAQDAQQNLQQNPQPGAAGAPLA